MKRYASHYLFLPGYGYLKQFSVETAGGRVMRMYPLPEEVEDTEWLPGVILLLNGEMRNADMRNNPTSYELYFDTALPLSSVPGSVEERAASFIPYLLSPFDFTTMRPVAGTRHRRLR